MNDMFDCDIGMPVRPLIDPRFGFDTWWKSYQCPTDRKKDKRYCEDFYIKNRLAEQATHLLLYTNWFMEQRSMTFRPGPKPFLRAFGWENWEPPTPKPVQKTWLEEYSEHEKHCTKPSAEIRAKMAQLRK